MQFPHDWLSKSLVVGALKGVCRVQSQVEVASEVNAIDALAKRIKSRQSLLITRGWLEEMVRRVSAIEAFSSTPTVWLVDDCVTKVGILHASQRKRAAEDRKPVPPRPELWIVSTGRAETAMKKWAMVATRSRPGMYLSRAPHGPRLVVASELPETRETLLLRMMASGATRRKAWAMYRALPADAWERKVVQPLLHQLQRDLSRMEWTEALTEELGMNYEELFENWEKEKILILKEGRDEGELRVLRGLYEKRLGRKLTEAERAKLQKRLGRLGVGRLSEVVLDLDADELAAWLKTPKAR